MFYVRGSGTRICVGERVQYLFTLRGVDDAIFSSPDEKLSELNIIGDVLVFLPINSGSCIKSPAYEAGN